MNDMTPLASGRGSYVGGSDARIIMGGDEAALIRLWREKRGEIEPEDLSTNLPVQLGVVTEQLNRRWFERETGRALEHVQKFVRHPKLDWMGATLDGLVKEETPSSKPSSCFPGRFRKRAPRKSTCRSCSTTCS